MVTVVFGRCYEGRRLLELRIHSDPSRGNRESKDEIQLNEQLSSPHISLIMSFYFAIIGTKDNPLFEFEFGTSKAGGDGVSRFREEQRHMNQFIVHSSLDIVEEVQWGTGSM